MSLRFSFLSAKVMNKFKKHERMGEKYFRIVEIWGGQGVKSQMSNDKKNKSVRFVQHAPVVRFVQHALKGQKRIAQGNALGSPAIQQCALKGQKRYGTMHYDKIYIAEIANCHTAFAPTGRVDKMSIKTQGVALG